MNKTPFAILGAGVLLAVVPWLGLPPFYESILYLVCHWMVLALSWNILSGYSGYFSFGHGVFFGIGMYTTAGFAGKLDWPFLATLPLADGMGVILSGRPKLGAAIALLALPAEEETALVLIGLGAFLFLRR